MSTPFDVTLPGSIPEDIQLDSGSLYDLDDGNWGDVLTSEEHDRRASFRNEARRRLFTLGRLVLRRHLGERLGMDPQHVPIGIHDSGRLILNVPAMPALRVSLAHSGENAIVVSGEHPLGVDMETMKPRTDRLLEYITHPDERPHLMHLAPTMHEQLHAVWTIKEAVLKGSGTGLRTSPKQLLIDTTPATEGGGGDGDFDICGWRHVRVVGPGQNTWDVVFTFREDIAVAMAWQAPR